MKVPLFSIVTVSLNAGSRLLSTVESLSRQGCDDWEHIIKDGGSTDGSVEVLPSDSRRKIVRCSDRGIFDAMNQALAECAGDYVLFLNAGDEFSSPDVLKLVAEAAEAGQAPLIYTNIHYRYGNCVRPYPKVLSRSYLFRQIPSQQALYVRRECYLKYGLFDLTYPCLSDPEMLLRLIIKHKVRTQHCSVAGVSFEGGGVSSTERFSRLAAIERRRLRKAYFTKSECFWWTLRRHILLQSLRMALNRRFPNGPVARLNNILTAFNNRLSSN